MKYVGEQWDKFVRKWNSLSCAQLFITQGAEEVGHCPKCSMGDVIDQWEVLFYMNTFPQLKCKGGHSLLFSVILYPFRFSQIFSHLNRDPNSKNAYVNWNAVQNLPKLQFDLCPTNLVPRAFSHAWGGMSKGIGNEVGVHCQIFGKTPGCLEGLGCSVLHCTQKPIALLHGIILKKQIRCFWHSNKNRSKCCNK